MHFLLSNDDGIRAEGVNTAIEVIEKRGSYTVVAPHNEQSGKGHSITRDIPVRLHKVRDNVYSLSGTPADCIKFALYELAQESPDLVISGINHGANLGQDTIYSGTVAAAIEAAMHDLPAIALSLCGLPPYRFDSAAIILNRVIDEFGGGVLPKGKVLNVNIPNIPVSEIKGIKFASLGNRSYEKKFHPAPNPRNIPFYWLGWTFGGFGEQNTPDSDCMLVDHGYVSLSLLKPSLLDGRENERLMKDGTVIPIY